MYFRTLQKIKKYNKTFYVNYITTLRWYMTTPICTKYPSKYSYMLSQNKIFTQRPIVI